MVKNTLLHPVSELQKSRLTDSSWAFLVSHLLRLLKLYSTGLSLPVILDHICSSQRTVSLSPSFRSARIDGIANSPNIWLLSLDDGSQVAHYPHSLFISRVHVGMTFSILSKFPDPGLQTRAEIDALRLAAAILSKSSTAPIRSPQDVKSIAQPAETPSQSADFTLKSVGFPTLAVLFHLNTFPFAAFGLTDPVASFTLQRVWNERSLLPMAVYSQVVSIDLTSGVVHLQDCPEAHSAQPVVRCLFTGGREMLLSALKPGCRLLLLSPDVHPNGSSFDLSTNESTTCAFSNTPDVDCSSLIGNELDSKERLLKRARTDFDLSKSTSPLYISSMLSLSHPDLQPPLVVHTRVVKPPCREAHHPNSWIVFVDTIAVRIRETFDDLSHFYEGDEILLSGFQSCKQSPTGWVADSVDNLSTSKAVLYAPFLRKVVDSTAIRRYLQEGALCSAHVCVHILNAEMINSNMRLQVRDAPFRGQVFNDQPWYVEVMENALMELCRDARIHIYSKEYDLLCHRLRRSEDNACFMTLTCFGKKWSVPKVRASVMATPAMFVSNYPEHIMSIKGKES